MLIANDSPLRRLPHALSKKQFLVFDGIRYAAEMADIAYSRLKATLFEISRTAENSVVPCTDIASALLDAWAVVDAVNRMRDLLAQGGHGVKLDTWYSLFTRRTDVVESLRNRVQHIENEIHDLASQSGQLWGYLTWAIPAGFGATPGWYGLVPGSQYAGDHYIIISEITRSITGSLGAVKLKAYGQELDFEKVLDGVADCVANLEKRIADGEVRLDTPAASGRHVGDSLTHMVLEVSVPVPK